jgi:hypothetical protein
MFKSAPQTSGPRSSSLTEIPQPESREPTEKPIPINGFQQVVDLLRAADPAFRESLLRRLAARDLSLANSLRKDVERFEFEV